MQNSTEMRRGHSKSQGPEGDVHTVEEQKRPWDRG